MEFKCLECGHLFPSSDVYHWTESHGEHMSGCPVCKCAFEEAVCCKKCGGGFLEDELYEGICEDCLAESMTVTTLMDYLRDSRLERDFYLEFLFGEEEALKLLRWEFLRMVTEDLCFASPKGGTIHGALERCIDFVVNGGDGLWEYAEWYTGQKGASAHDRAGIPLPSGGQPV